MLNHYTLFRRRAEPSLCCAVPQDRPVPGFISGEDWEFQGVIVDNGSAPAGFRSESASWVTNRTGYYLFHALGAGR